MRDHVSKGLKEIAAVDADKRLSAEGKREKKREIARQVLNATPGARQCAEGARGGDGPDETLGGESLDSHQTREDHVTAVLHAQCRRKNRRLERRPRQLPAAVRHRSGGRLGPARSAALPLRFERGELAMVRDAVERKFLSPEIVEAKGEVGEALLETERGLRAAQHMIRQHAGLDKPITAAWPRVESHRGENEDAIARVEAPDKQQRRGVCGERHHSSRLRRGLVMPLGDGAWEPSRF